MASCRGGILQERQGLQSWTDPLNQSVFVRRREGGRAGPCAPTQGPATGNMPQCEATHPRWLDHKSHGSHLQRPINALGVSVQYGAHSSPTLFFFFCQSAYLNSFRGLGGGGACVVCPRRLQGAHEAWVILWLLRQWCVGNHT